VSSTEPAARRIVPVVVLIVAVALRAALLSLACLLLWAAVPAAFGWTPSTVVSDSMRPAVAAGDVVVAMPVPPADVRRGQVVLVPHRGADGYLLHRVHATEGERLELKGDANPTADTGLVDRADVRGVGVLRVPVVGLPVVWLRNGDRLALGGAVLGGLLAAVGVLATRRTLAPDEPDEPDEHDEHDEHDGGATDIRSVPSPLHAPSTDDDAAAADTVVLPVVGPAPRTSGDLFARTPMLRGLGRRIGPRTCLVLIAVVTTAAVVAVLAALPRAGATWSGATRNTGNTLATTRYTCMDGTADDAVVRFGYNDPTGTSEPNRGSGPPGVLSGGVTRSAGSCADSPHVVLDGKTGRVRADGATTAPGEFTVETWFRTTSAGGMLVGFGSTRDARSPSHDRHLYIDTAGRLVFGVWANGAARTATAPGTVTDGRWHHAVGTMSPTGGLRLHLDGALVGSNTNTVTQQWEGYWRIGWESLSSWPGAPSDEHYAGALDETRVYLRALTAPEVQAHHDAGR
jgi:signal peptidase I